MTVFLNKNLIFLFAFISYTAVSQELPTSGNILESNLPIIAINTSNQDIPDEPKVNVLMAVLDNQNGDMNILPEGFNGYNINIGIETRGQSSQFFYPKKSYSLETRDENGDNLNMTILGLPEENDWIIYGPYGDKTLIRNILAYDLAGKIMDWAPHLVFCELVIDNSYKGVYLFGEKIKRDKNRVDISKLTKDDISGDELTGGYILKIDKGEQDGVSGWHSSHAPPNSNNKRIYFQYHYPKFDDILPEQQNYIQTYISDFENMLKSPGYNDPDFGYQAYIDVESFIDYFIINELCKNIDGYRLSTYFYKDKDSEGGKLKMGPIWDFNLAFGNANYCHAEEKSGWVYKYNETCPEDYWLVPFWWERLMEDSYFQDRLKTRWVELRRGPFRNDSIFNRINGYVSDIGPAISRNFTRWPIFGEWVWPNFYVGNSYQEEMDYLKDWMNNRLRFLDYYMPGNVITSMEEVFVNNNIKIYPNPVESLLNIDIKGNTHKEFIFKLFNSEGKLISEETIKRIPYSITLDEIPPGLYFYNLMDKHQKQLQKGKLIKN